MSQPLQTQPAVPRFAVFELPASRATRFFLAVLCGSALLAASAHIAVPLFFTPVPFTLQPFAVLLLALLLDPAAAFATLAAYLLEGVAGLPVFTPQGPGGILQLMGPSGGFLLSYPFAAVLVSAIYRRRPASFSWAAISAATGSAVYFIGGAAWLVVAAHQHWNMALKFAVWPFLAGDALKVILAAAIVTGLARTHRLRNVGPLHQK